MKLRWPVLILFGTIHTLAVHAAETIDVHIYLQGGDQRQTLERSRALASILFERINLRLKWHTGKPPESKRGNETVVAIQILRFAPANLRLNALAEARPFGVSERAITIYQDRVQAVVDRVPALGDFLWAYIFAHELGHVLQGTATHTDQGIMRANWTYSDNMAMLSRRLSFTESDAVRIREGAVGKEIDSR